MKTKFGFLLIFLFLSASFACDPASENDWIEDLKYLQEQLPLKQKDFDKLISRSDFNQAIDQLIERVDGLENVEIVMEMQKIVAMLGVSHTLISFYRGQDFSTVPLHLAIFDDGLYIVGIGESNSAHLKSKVVGIEGVPIEEVYELIEPYISYENEYWLKSQLPYLLRHFSLLNHVGIGQNPEFITYNLENGDALKVQMGQDQMAYVPESFTPLWQRNQRQNYWWQEIDKEVLYIQYDKCREDANYPFAEFVEEIGNTIDSSGIDAVAVDIRINTGGSSNVILPLINELQKRENLEVYGLISRGTFSSGRFAARDLKRDLNATLVGEPTGGSPNSYGESKSFTLPNSGVNVNYCVKYFSLMDIEEDYIPPDVRVYYNSADYFSGKDPLLDYVMNQHKN